VTTPRPRTAPVDPHLGHEPHPRLLRATRTPSGHILGPDLGGAVDPVFSFHTRQISPFRYSSLTRRADGGRCFAASYVWGAIGNTAQIGSSSAPQSSDAAFPVLVDEPDHLFCWRIGLPPRRRPPPPSESRWHGAAPCSPVPNDAAAAGHRWSTRTGHPRPPPSLAHPQPQRLRRHARLLRHRTDPPPTPTRTHRAVRTPGAPPVPEPHPDTSPVVTPWLHPSKTRNLPETSRDSHMATGSDDDSDCRHPPHLEIRQVPVTCRPPSRPHPRRQARRRLLVLTRVLSASCQAREVVPW